MSTQYQHKAVSYPANIFSEVGYTGRLYRSRRAEFVGCSVSGIPNIRIRYSVMGPKLNGEQFDFGVKFIDSGYFFCRQRRKMV